MMRKTPCVWWVLAWAFGLVGQAAQAEPTPTPDERQLPAVDVRAKSTRASERESVHNVTVITREDIARSTASSVGELLAGQGNLDVRSYTGNDKDTVLDMRGMGATAGSNVLVVVDGVVINENDLSGADLGSLSLSQIDRIEVVRGGGGVQHGNGAVAGVIRITTLPSLDEGEGLSRLSGRVNSDWDRQLALGVQRRLGAWSASFQLDRTLNRGHRDNATLDAKLAAFTLRSQQATRLGALDAHLKLTHQRDRYGLPGYVTLEAFEGSDADRRATRTPLNGGRTLMNRQDLGASLDWGRPGQTTWHASHRSRRKAFLDDPSPLVPLSEQDDIIDVTQWNHQLSHAIQRDVLGLKQELTLGLASMRGEIARSRGGFERLGSTLYDGRATSRAGFVDTTLRPTESITVQAGVRVDRFQTHRGEQAISRTCRKQLVFLPGLGLVEVDTNDCVDSPYQDNGPRSSRSWFNRASELGVNWQVMPGWSIHASHNQTYRAPNLDELVLATGDLRPQHGRTSELGVRHRQGTELSWSATLFDIRIEDEIYFGMDPQTGSELNRNLELGTRRRGIELGARWQPVAALQVHGQFTHLRPTLGGSAFDIPLVARNTASLGVRWQATDAWRWSLSGRFVGPRGDGTVAADGSPLWRRLRAHDVWDIGVQHRLDGVEVGVGVSNLFDERYSTVAYNQTYYPMPGRQAYIKVSMQH